MKNVFLALALGLFAAACQSETKNAVADPNTANTPKADCCNKDCQDKTDCCTDKANADGKTCPYSGQKVQG